MVGGLLRVVPGAGGCGGPPAGAVDGCVAGLGDGVEDFLLRADGMGDGAACFDEPELGKLGVCAAFVAGLVKIVHCFRYKCQGVGHIPGNGLLIALHFFGPGERWCHRCVLLLLPVFPGCDIGPRQVARG